MLFLPGQRALTLGMQPLALAKGTGVDALAASRAGLGRANLVAHLVVDDEFDQIVGDLRAVERRVDADVAVVVEVDAHLDASPPPPRGCAAPADFGVDRAVEVALVEGVEDRLEIAGLAAARRGRAARGARGWRCGARGCSGRASARPRHDAGRAR